MRKTLLTQVKCDTSPITNPKSKFKKTVSQPNKKYYISVAHALMT